MSVSANNSKHLQPNLLLIAGNGRNVGKTFLACALIQQLSWSGKVTGLKITPHFHAFNEKDVLIRNENFIVLDETRITKKDSSLMLQAGADRVFFVMVHREHLQEAFEALLPLLPEHPVVCESGGLHEFVLPGLFFFVNLKGREISKKHLLAYDPVLVTNNGKDFSIDLIRIRHNEHGFTYEL